MMPVRLEPATPRSRVKHSTTEPLRSLSRLSIMLVFNPMYSNGLSHTDISNKDGLVHYMFKGQQVVVSQL